MGALVLTGGCFFQSLDADAARDSESDSGTATVTEGLGTGETDPNLGGSGMVEADSTTAEAADAMSSEAGPGDGTSGDDEPPMAVGECCLANGTPGCDDIPGVSECVCRFDSFCCEAEWDETCVEVAIASGCAECTDVEPTVPPGPSDCCEATEAGGCLDAQVQDCVCAIDAFCCDVQWDGACVEAVEANQCGCGFEAQSGTADDSMVTDSDTGPGVQGDCCTATQAGGCLDLELQTCVCDNDPFCCDTAWDNQCVTLVNTYGCGSCVYPLGEGDCCVENGSMGCDDQLVQDCVCAEDPFCCSIMWDAACVAQVGEYACGSCGASTTFGTATDSGVEMSGTSDAAEPAGSSGG
ncbi:MAG: hypothetical protein AAF721_19355 [Myxococcota bacterium]